MQAFSRLLPLSIGCAAAAIMAGSAFAQTAARPGIRYRIAEGQWARSVNEPTISRLSPNSPPGNTFMVVWQQHAVIPQGEFESPQHLFRANGVYTYSAENGGTIDWSVPAVPIPKPNLYQSAADPSVIMTEDQQNWRFVVAGAASSASYTWDAYALATFNQTLTFDTSTLTTFDYGAPGSTRFSRLGVKHVGLFQQDLDTVVLLAQNQFVADGEVGQIFLRRSVDSGVTWGPNGGVDAWLKLAINEVPIVGYTSAPVFPYLSGGTQPMFAYGAETGRIKGAYEVANGSDVFNTTGNLDVDPVIDVNVGQGETYHARSNDAIAGGFGIRPFPSITGRDLLSDIVYIVYQDFKTEALDEDGNFDVYIIRGRFVNGLWVFGDPWRLNDEDFDVRADQFMPVVYADPGVGKQIHVAWYDTVHDPKGPNEDVKIALYYARLRDLQDDDPEGDPGFAIEDPVLLDIEAINTAYLTNPKFLGNRIDMMVTIDRHDAVVVYMGTEHPRAGQQTAPQDNEAIFAYTVPQDY
jgi:hypothetical protein